ncbi:hypothetical protein NPX13_g5075 [Xylaria arbuscula]|uniref:Transmembrane protein n=1 Tax=Xylaria arbuscula TaxID=114810 RepID=A0A9W8TLM3_9PEZI|nr:hypothetical protein NPX13_g5075 [Xylaria arbuscula]
MDALIRKIVGFEDIESWKGQCATKIREAVEADQSSNVFNGLVDRAGDLLQNPLAAPEIVAGINYNTCKQYCSYEQLSTVFSFQVFSAGATNYLLPWLALTAQLPFETGENEIIANVMSFCYAESQQLPLRLSQENGSLASLILLPDNADWWEKLKTNILLTRRGVTLSLIAQILVAVLSWILTVISAFVSSLGDASEALALSSGSLWVWLIPIIYGYILVGTQREYGTITKALKRDMTNIVDGRPSSQDNPDPPAESRTRRDTVVDGFVDAPSRPFAVGQGNEIRRSHDETNRSFAQATPRSRPQQASTVQIATERQRAFKVADERKLMQPLTRSPTAYGFLHLEPPSSNLGIPNCLGFSVAGDEKQEGPAFNYARIFTWWKLANRLYEVLETTDDRLFNRLDLELEPVPRNQKFKQRNLTGDVLTLSHYCGLARKVENATGPTIEPEQITEYPHWKDLDASFYQRIIFAMAIAFYVQWGITTAAIIIAYLTEVTGLGCRSGSYLLYGVLATFAFFFLFLSSMFSHAAMVRHEESHISSSENLHGSREKQEPNQKPNAPGSRETPTGKFTFGHNVLRFCAVVTRVLGRTLAIVNTFWIFLSTIWELVGFYNNCWCDSVALSKGPTGWILLFVESSELATAATPSWAGSVFLSVFVVDWEVSSLGVRRAVLAAISTISIAGAPEMPKSSPEKSSATTPSSSSPHSWLVCARLSLEWRIRLSDETSVAAHSKSCYYGPVVHGNERIRLGNDHGRAPVLPSAAAFDQASENGSTIELDDGTTDGSDGGAAIDRASENGSTIELNDVDADDEASDHENGHIEPQGNPSVDNDASSRSSDLAQSSSSNTTSAEYNQERLVEALEEIDIGESWKDISGNNKSKISSRGRLPTSTRART